MAARSSNDSPTPSAPPLTPDEIDQLVHLAHRALWADVDVRRTVQDRGVMLVPPNFYSSVPTIAEVADSFEHREPGAAPFDNGLFDPEVIGEFIDTIAVYAEEFDPPLEGDREHPEGYFWRNPAFSYSDAMSYYCILRHAKPESVVEIGSGFSTLVADAALRRNGHGLLTIIEPYPKPFLRELATVDRIIETGVQELDLDELVALVDAAGVWFIDSTHTVKAGSDCLRIYLQILPRVSTETLVHSHDIYLPFGFPRMYNLDHQVYWTEQYLLAAYLLDNPKVQVVFGSAYGKRKLPDAVEQLMGGKHAGGGGSLWFRLNGSASRG